MFCTRCGAQVPDGTKFCPKCGQKLMTAPQGGGTDGGAQQQGQGGTAGGYQQQSAGNGYQNGSQTYNRNTQPYAQNQQPYHQNTQQYGQGGPAYGQNGYQRQPYQQNSSQNNGNEPGKGAAIASLVLGIISVVFWFFNVGAIVSVICGIIGLVTASNAKKAGFNGGLRTAGFVLSLIGLIGGAIVFIAALACVGTVGAVIGSLY